MRRKTWRSEALGRYQATTDRKPRHASLCRSTVHQPNDSYTYRQLFVKLSSLNGKPQRTKVRAASRTPFLVFVQGAFTQSTVLVEFTRIPLFARMRSCTHLKRCRGYDLSLPLFPVTSAFRLQLPPTGPASAMAK